MRQLTPTMLRRVEAVKQKLAALERAVKWKRKAIRQVAGGVCYESVCGRWRVCHESPKTRRGKKLRQWWFVLEKRGQTFQFRGLGGYCWTSRDNAYTYKTRREA